MYLYVIFAILVILAFWDIVKPAYRRHKYHIIIFNFVILCLFVISAFRIERGTDWGSYEYYYKLAANWDFDGWMEIGYTLFNKVVNLLSNNYSVFVFIVAMVIYASKPKIIYNFSPFPFVALLVWWTINFADVFPTRQTLASALVVYSYIYIYRRQFIPFVILILCASSIHLSSSIFFVSYFLFDYKLNRSFMLCMFFGAYIIAFISDSIMSNILSGIPIHIIQDRIITYTEQGADNVFGMIYSTRQVLIRGLINRGLIMFLVFTILNNLRDNNSFFNWLVNNFMLGSIIFGLLTSVNVALGRLASYFDISQIFIIPYVFTAKMDVNNKLIVFSILILYLGYRFYGVVNNYYDLYIPYKALFWNSSLPVLVG